MTKLRANNYVFATGPSGATGSQANIANLFIYGGSFSVSQFQGDTHGYTAGGGLLGTPSIYNTIDRFPFASTTTNATDVGDLTQVRYYGAGHSSVSHGYNSSGFTTVVVNTNDKFPFAITANATDVGDVTVSRSAAAGHSSSTHGYTSAGFLPPGTSYNTIDRFPFAVDENSTDVSDLSSVRYSGAGISSTSDGYHASGFNPPANISGIDKFPFATNSNASAIGDVTVARRFVAGVSSSTHGYTVGGFTATTVNVIDRFPFAVNANATDVGDLSAIRYGPAGISSTTHGYATGGYVPPAPIVGSSNVIDRFPFASTTTNATDVGDLTQRRYAAGGTQD